MAEEETKWSLALSVPRQYEKFFKRYRHYTKFKTEFEEDVTANPFHHQKPNKIVKLQPQAGYPDDTYRWRQKDLRIVYAVNKPEKIIQPLEANTTEGISYR